MVRLSTGGGGGGGGAKGVGSGRSSPRRKTSLKCHCLEWKYANTSNGMAENMGYIFIFFANKGDILLWC